ncbi:MAG TPA: vitamin K epoxide reductase family protein [Kofleriaceae bacterium]|nr:vitamin K epoxide reductase family protein [Kofleriaceae bacterium]
MRRPQPWLILVLVGATVGLVFAAVSTYDFVQHLDRQVHSLHCSFIPGVTHTGESGCQVAMMSPYSSVMRTGVWGGIPISLPAMSVFAFLVFYTLDLLVTRRKDDPRATGFLALASVLPAATSAVMLGISLSKLGTVCKLCVCIYIASAAVFIGALIVWRSAVAARRGQPIEPPVEQERHRGEPAFVGRARAASTGQLVAVGAPGVSTAPASGGFIAAMFAVGVAFVAVPIALYLGLSPDHARFIGTCEGLSRPDDTYGIMMRVDRASARGAPTIEVLDPLCPACKAFEQRLAASGLGERLDRKAVLFPLDNTCNWMVTEATHPGACTVSEAVLCAGDKAPDVIAWAFDEQERIRNETRADPTAAARIVKQRFPNLASCVGSPDARSRLNKSLRWIVANNIRVLTPQIFIDRVKLCDEDVDLGLEYTLSNMLERHAAGKLSPLEKPPGKAAEGAGAPPDKSAAGSAGADKASADKASADKPSSDKPSSDKSSSDKPTSDKASESASTSGSAAEKPATEPSDKASGSSTEGAAPASESKTDSAAPASADKPASGNAPEGGSGKAPPGESADKGTSEKATDKPTDKAAPRKASDTAATNADKSAEKPARKPPPRRTPPRRPAPKPPADNGPADQPVTRPGEVR